MPARPRKTASILLVLLVAVLGPALGGTRSTDVEHPRLGAAWAAEEASPANLWNDPVLVSLNQAHRETSIALSPTDPNLLFVCDPSGVPNTGGNQSYFHRSTNGGRNWSYIDVEGPATDPRNYAFEGGDCDVMFDAGGTMYSADTWLGSLSIGHSTDGGATWDGTSVAASAPVVDRPWIVGGPAGTLHVTYQDVQFAMPSAIWYTRSTDYGKTFLPAVPVTQAGLEGAFTWEGNFVVSPNGQDLHLVYTRRQGPAAGSLDATGPEKVFVAASHNGGLTWTSSLVASMPNPASYLYPSIAMDDAGWLHVVFASRTGEDRPIWYSFSKNGTTWTPATPLMRGASGYSPWVDGGEAGEAAITWYGSPTPMTSMGESVDWYFYWARVTGADTASPSVAAGTTTDTPIFTGTSGIPEFEMVRLDADGRMHLGMSAYRKKGTSSGWSIYYQREILPLVTGSGTLSDGSSFSIDAERDGAVTGTLTFEDPAQDVSINATSFDGLVLEKITGGLSCTLTGQAEVTRSGTATTEPFTATCRDLTSGDAFTIDTTSYQGGGALSAGSLKVG